jgi:hypothetical protein
MKNILQKPSGKRTDEDLDELVGLIKDIAWFKERQNLSANDIRELAACFQFEEVQEFNDVMEFGDTGESFYLILQGLVSV